MAKILIRAGFSPLEHPKAGQIVLENLIWENSGNMLFPYSIMRMLMCEGTEFTAISVDRYFSSTQIAEWNAQHDCFIIPLANAFRDTFLTQLKLLTALVKKLSIPCIVIGAGIQVSTDGMKETSQEFDRTVSAFVRAVLKKSSLLGIRGEFTAQYLKRLGFTEEKDFTIIGCPSMYLHGPFLPSRKVKELDEQSPVSINCKIKIPAKLHTFIFSSAKRFIHYTYVPQGIDDLRLLYAGISINREKFPKINKGYPWQLHSRICACGHETGFTDVRSWLAFLEGVDFSFGTRIHGNIAAILAGTPAFIFAPDGRILELARYHQIPHMAVGDLSDETDIFRVFEQADFSSVQRGHAHRFAHYEKFLEQNGLTHIDMHQNAQTPFDIKMAQIPMHGPLRPLHKAPLKEQTARLQAYDAHMRAEAARLQDHAWMKKASEMLPDAVRLRAAQWISRR